MQHYAVIFALSLLAFQAVGQTDDGALPPPGESYQFFTDLTRVSGDQLEITLVPPKLSENTVRYCFPKIVPGIYGAMDFGQYVADLRAFDHKDRPLPVVQENVNVWRIEKAKNLRRIQYRVNDTWDNLVDYNKGFYRPAGATFHAGDGFVINHNALFGFFEGHTGRPYQIQFRKPEGFFGATALENVARTETTETMIAPNYRALVDAPVLFGLPDTAQFRLGQTEILIAVFNAMPGQNYPYAPYLKEVLEPQLAAMPAYFGGSLPVKKYAFLVYFEAFDNDNMLADALEHQHSSLYLYAGRGMGTIAGLIRHISAHEFLHIITPLNIHSEKIAQYNFIEPSLSQHLWLYEGMTEYMSLHAGVTQKTLPFTDFLQKIADKYREMQQFDAGISLTELSRNALTRQDQYYNFYLKGALANLCLDIRLREYSGGKYGTANLMLDLAKKYGPDRPFPEAGLFDEIAAMTHPEIRDFFRRYVEGTEPLPLAEDLLKVGIVFDPQKMSVDIVGNPTPDHWKMRTAWLGM
ncbi:MAG: peptidase M61 [Thermoanaerobaculia bacterium]|nr:peptidase M61 [Thermoanaerobaculia bacterium]